MKKTYLLSLFVLVLLLSGCGSQYSAEKLYWHANQASKELAKGRPLDKLDSQDYDKIISGYRRLVERFPLESVSAQSQFIITQIYVLRKQYPKAEEELVRVIQNFSNNAELASQAQFMITTFMSARVNRRRLFRNMRKSAIFPFEQDWAQDAGVYRRILSAR